MVGVILLKLSDIICKLEEFAPPVLAEEWDNVGLMVGGKNCEIKSAVVVLDVTEKAVNFAIKEKCDLIISHHPFIMPKLPFINFDTKKGELIEMLIKNNICVYSMHTNFDAAVGGVNDELFEKFSLENKEIVGMVRKGTLKKPMTLKNFIDLTKRILHTKNVVYCGDLEKNVEKIALCGGSGGSFIGHLRDCDVFLTGEAKYHEYQQACETGLCVVSAGHFETENIALYKIREILEEMKIEIKDADIHESFSHII